MTPRCARKACKEPTDHISGYCSDLCVRLEHDLNLPPVTVLARSKAGGVGVGLEWQKRQPVILPRSA